MPGRELPRRGGRVKTGGSSESFAIVSVKARASGRGSRADAGWEDRPGRRFAPGAVEFGDESDHLELLELPPRKRDAARSRPTRGRTTPKLTGESVDGELQEQRSESGPRRPAS